MHLNFRWANRVPMSDAAVQRLSGILSELQKLIPAFVSAIGKFDEQLSPLDEAGLAKKPKQDADYWVAVAYRNALISRNAGSSGHHTLRFRDADLATADGSRAGLRLGFLREGDL